MSRRPTNETAAAIRPARLTGGVLGVGLTGAADEILFHQLLQWHNFYVHSAAYWRVASDGFFHLFTTTLLGLAAFLLWRQRRQFSTLTSSRPFWSGLFFGAGGFQIFDGVVNHKILQLHPVREGAENILLYDTGWIVAGLLFLYCGWLLWRKGT